MATTTSAAAIASVCAPARALSADELARYERDGFVVLEHVVPEATCAALRARADDIVARWASSDECAAASKFSTRAQGSAAAKRDDYFLASGGRISCFWEEHAFDESGALVAAAPLCVNKIGHALHERDDVFRAFVNAPLLPSLARALGFRQPLLAQSMYITKQPAIGGEVSYHQDSTFLHTAPLSTVGFWIALEDATTDNGCLWALPGSHKSGVDCRFVRRRDGSGGGGGVELVFEPPRPDAAKYDARRSDFVALPAKAGTMVVLHGSTVHYSPRNTSKSSRHAFTQHVIEGDGCEYDERNWLQIDRPFPQFEQYEPPPPPSSSSS